MKIAELGMEEATGDIASIYSAIEAGLGVRLVNLVYRHMATIPGALEWSWGIIGTLFESGELERKASLLIEFSEAQLRENAGFVANHPLGNIPTDSVRETLEAYNRANPMNVIGIRVIGLALQSGRPAYFHCPQFTQNTGLVELLPLKNLKDIDGDTIDTLQNLALISMDAENDPIIPSLYRHFVPWPRLLESILEWLTPIARMGVIEKFANELSVYSTKIAEEVYNTIEDVDRRGVILSPDVRQKLSTTIDIFPPSICRMIVIGRLMRSLFKI